MRFKEYYLNERMGSTFRSLVVVDVQPLYKDNIKFDLTEFGDFLTSIKKNILYFYNGPETIASEDSPDVIRSWLAEYNESLYTDWDWNNVDFYDKGYSFFRDFLDHGISENGVKQTLRYMYNNKITDSRDVPLDQWKNILSEEDYNNGFEAIEDEGITIWNPDINIAELKRDFNNCLLCGGGMNECLKEIQILFGIFNIRYTLVNKFIF